MPRVGVLASIVQLSLSFISSTGSTVLSHEGKHISTKKGADDILVSAGLALENFADVTRKSGCTLECIILPVYRRTIGVTLILKVRKC